MRARDGRADIRDEVLAKRYSLRGLGRTGNADANGEQHHERSAKSADYHILG
jgi:hypothetical protein